VAGLRERKKAATRVAIRDAGMRLFAEQGFARTTIDQIADAAGVSRTTFFRYFPSKEAVIFASQNQTIHDFARLLSERPAEESALRAFEEAVVEFARRTADDQVRKRRALELWALYAANPELRARMIENRQMWVDQMAATFARRDGVEEPDARHCIASAVAMELLQQVNEEWQRANGELPAEDLIRERFKILRELAAG
jgi:AcrR family transcriptional regulator